MYWSPLPGEHNRVKWTLLFKENAHQYWTQRNRPCNTPLICTFNTFLSLSGSCRLYGQHYMVGFSSCQKQFNWFHVSHGRTFAFPSVLGVSWRLPPLYPMGGVPGASHKNQWVPLRAHGTTSRFAICGGLHGISLPVRWALCYRLTQSDRVTILLQTLRADKRALCLILHVPFGSFNQRYTNKAKAKVKCVHIGNKMHWSFNNSKQHYKNMHVVVVGQSRGPEGCLVLLMLPFIVGWWWDGRPG